MAMAAVHRRCSIAYAFLVALCCSAGRSAKDGNDSTKKVARRQMGVGMDMSMGLGMNMAMNMIPSSFSGSSFASMSNPLSLQMPFAPNPFYNQMFPTRRHQLSLDGNGQDFLEQPLNPYEKVLNSKYPTSPFERLFGKTSPLSAPGMSTVLTSYQTNAMGGGFDEQQPGSGGYTGSYSGAYEGDFGIQFGRRSATTTTALGKSKLLHMSTVRSDVFYQNEAYADYFGW